MLDDLQIFCGELTPATARVYARLPRPSAPGRWQLAGVLSGPHCALARTLAASSTFAERAGGDWLVAEAFVPDPCFWTGELPQLYTAQIELRRDGARVAECQRSIGLRPLSVAGRRLRLDGHNWVMRAIGRECLGDVSAEECRALGAVLRCAADQLPADAERLGPMLVVDLGGAGDLLADLARVARHPAVAMAIVDTTDEQAAPLRQAAPNLLLAERAGNDAWRPASWAQVVIASGDALPRWVECAGKWALPVIAERRLNAVVDLATARAACDALQRDLAGQGEFAGYWV